MSEDNKPAPFEYRSAYASLLNKGNPQTDEERNELINKLDKLSPQAFNGLLTDLRTAVDTPRMRVAEPAIAGVAGFGLGYLAQWALDARVGGCVPVTGAPGVVVAAVGGRHAKSPTRKAAFVTGGSMVVLGSQVYGWTHPRSDTPEDQG